MSISIARRVFTVAEYERMGKAGILSEDDRVELIEGEIITKSPIGSRHAACVNRLNNLLAGAISQSAIVSVQNPFRLTDYSEPEPDIALLRPRADFYASNHPTPADVLLIVEVAETSLEYDSGVKIPLYAQVIIPEVWLADLEHQVIMQYTRPSAGTYQEVRQIRRGESLISSVFPDLELSVDKILG